MLHEASRKSKKAQFDELTRRKTPIHMVIGLSFASDVWGEWREVLKPNTVRSKADIRI